MDAAGNAYVTGETSSSDFPTTAGAFDTTDSGGDDAFVAKLNASGSALLYSTYLGGSGDDKGEGIAVDAAGNVYATGETYSSDFPTTAGALDTTYNGGGDAFVAKFSGLAVPAAPTVSAFNVTPTSVTAGSPVTISFTVSDTGGPGLSGIWLYRAPDAGGTPGTWGPVGSPISLSGDGPVSNYFSDTPAAGKWWYGFIVYDSSGNWNNEQNVETGGVPDFQPIQVTVTAAAPTMTLNSPNAGATWLVGKSQTMGWSISGDTSQISYLSVLLSTDNGSSYTAISPNLSARRNPLTTRPRAAKSPLQR